jgi:hypothetical protein
MAIVIVLGIQSTTIIFLSQDSKCANVRVQIYGSLVRGKRASLEVIPRNVFPAEGRMVLLYSEHDIGGSQDGHGYSLKDLGESEEKRKATGL